MKHTKRMMASRARAHRRRMAAVGARGWVGLERLETRSMLSIAPNRIPENILPLLSGTAVNPPMQTAFAPGASTLAAVTPAAKLGVQASYYEFSVSGVGLSGTVSIASQTASNAVDVALALYDADGNLLQAADADAPSVYAGVERIVATLDSAHAYVIGVFARNDDPSSSGGDPLMLAVDTGDQRINGTIKVDPATGKASVTFGAGVDRLQGASDVNYFPIKLTNLGQQATITLQASAPASAGLFGELYRRDSSRDPWTPVASAVSGAGGGGITLQPQSTPGVSLNDSEYLLAVSAKGLASPVQSYTVSINGNQSLLVPASVATQGATDLKACVPTSPGVAGVSFTGSKTPLPSTFLVRATLDGPLRLQVSPGFKPVVSVYDSTGKKLLGVASRTTAGQSLDLGIEARAGRQYLVRVASLSNVKSGDFTLTASQVYLPTALAATAVVGTTKTNPGPLSLDPAAGGRFFRITPAADADILVLRLTASTGTVTATPQLWILEPGSPQTPLKPVTPAPGQKSIDYAIDLTKSTGPFDVFVTGVGGVGTADLSYAAATLPRTLSAADFVAGAIDLQKGSLTTVASKGSVPFGTLWSKVAFSEVGPGAIEKISTVAAGPAAVLEYVQQGDTFELKDWSVRTDGKPSLTGFVPGKQRVGAASLSLSLGGVSGLGISVAGPQPRAGVGVAMVPDLKNPLQSLLQIRDQYLQSPEQRDLWETLLPGNVVGNKSQELRFEPGMPQGTLRAKVTALDAADKPLVSGTSLAGQPLVLSLTASMVAAVVNAGGKLRLLVEPLAGSQIGDGGYSLKLTAATGDSRPFEVTESRFYPAKPAGWDQATKGSLAKLDQNGSPLEGILPTALKIQPMSFPGLAVGAITSSASCYSNTKTGNADAIDVYSFTLPVDPQTHLPAPQPFEIRTTAVAGSTVDTTIGLYIAKYKINNNQVTKDVEWYEQVESVPSSRDYYPSDRSTVDAKIVVNNPAYLYEQFRKPYGKLYAYDDSSYRLYVVVKAQYGTKGLYTISVAATEPQHVGPRPADPAAATLPDATTAIDPVTGTAAAISGNFGFNTPSTFNAGAEITATIHTSNGQLLGGQVFVDVSDAGNTLLFTQSTTAFSNTLTVPLDDAAHPFQPSSRYFLRVRSAKAGLDVTGTDLAGDVSPGAPIAPSSIAVSSKLSNVWPEIAPHANLSPSPDGQASGKLTAVGGLTTVQQRLFFYADAGGPATFTIKDPIVTGGTWALYRMKFGGAGEVSQITGQLVDFVRLTGGTQTFVDYLAPGAYELQLYGNANGASDDAGSYEVQLPAFDATDIPLDPNTGNNSTKPLLFREPEVDAPAAELLTTQFLRVAAPADAAKGWSVDFAFQSAYEKTDASLATIQLLDEFVAPKDTFAIYKRNAFTDDGASAAIFKRVDYTFDADVKTDLFFDPFDPQKTLEKYTHFSIFVDEQPLPGDEYFIGHNSFLNSTQYFVGPHFTLPESGDPDLVVERIDLKPSSGRTYVDIEVRNEGYGSAGDFAGRRTLSNYTPADGTLDFSSLGAHASLHRTFEWLPDDPSDFVSMLVNQPDTIHELRTDNNRAKVLLSSVDPHKPTVAIALKDTAMDGESGAVWGRYLSDVHGVPLEFAVTAADADSDYFQTKVFGMVKDKHTAVNGTSVAGYVTPFSPDAGDLKPTTAANPNEIHYQVFDQYGLRTDELVQVVDVVPKPTFWQDNTGGSVVDGLHWNAAKHGYDIVLNYNFVNYDKTVEQLLGSVPFIGDKRNTFTINVSGAGFASLDPTFVPDVPIKLTLLLKVVDEDLFNEVYEGSQPIGDHTTLTLAPIVDPRTVDLKGASISLQLRDYPILHWDSPKVPVYSLGVKGIASFDINLGFSIDVTLDAGVKLGVQFDPFMVGLMAPTFLGPAVTPSATISGDVEVLGLPLAGIEGSVGLEINLAAGLANVGYADVIPFDELFDNFNVGTSFQLVIGAKAKLAGGTVWSTQYEIPLTSPDTGGVITTDNQEAGGNPLAKAFAMAFGGLDAVGQPLAVPANAIGSPTPVIAGGNAVIEDDGFVPVPQMIIDPHSGAGLLVQTVQVDSSEPGKKKGILQVSSRSSLGGWTAPVNLPSADASNPVLAYTHDAAGTSPAVVVYEGLTGYDAPSGRQLGDVLSRHDLRYRYYDGTNWSAEMPLTAADGRYDSQASIAFNGSGQGVAAWVRNASATPFAADGSYARDAQDVQAAVWNAATHAWSAPLTISKAGDGVADIKPSTVVDATGNAIVTWIRGGADANTLFFSRYDGKAWSVPAEVPVDGMTPGSYGEIALGVDDQGLVNLLFSHRVKNADGTLDSRLYDRATAFAAFGQAAGYDQVSRTFAGYSHLRTTADADGTLVAYWQQSDGVNDGVYATALTKAAGGPRAAWSAPARLTTTRDVTRMPSLAVDLDGRLQTLYASSPLADNPLLYSHRPAPLTAPVVSAPTVAGVGSVSYAPLPELSFAKALSFDQSKSAVAGTTAIGRATLVNAGMAGDSVTISWFQGLPGGSVVAGGGTLLGTKTITLSPGASYDLALPFPVADGSQVYSVQVAGTKGEAITTTDDVSTTELEGKPDVVVETVSSSVAALPGAPVTLVATLSNPSDMPVDGFDVELYAGDPQFPQNPVELIATGHVDGLAAKATTTVSFPASLPIARGIYTFTVRADSGRAVDEAVEANNDGHFTGRFKADPAIGFDAVGRARVTATLLDASGVNNVEVKAVVRNGGDVAITNLPVHLTASRNDAEPQPVGDQIINTLAPGEETTLTFLVSGLDGSYRYRASLDDAVEATDDNPSNNTGTTVLVIHGMADLVLGTPVLSTQTPMQGWPLSLQATVGNVGIADARGVLVEVFAKGRDAQGNGYLLRVGGTTIDLDALSHQSVTLPVDTTQLLGDVVLIVRVNRFHTVLESNELNDTASVPTFFAPKIIPQVTSVAAPAAATYVQGAELTFTVSFNEPVTVVGQPAIGLIVGQKSRTATYVSGSGTTMLVFRSVVQGGDVDPNGISLTGLTFPVGSSIKDAIGTAALATLPAANTAGILVDALAPFVQSIVAPAVKTYGLDQQLTFQVIFNEPVTVFGAPTIALKVGSRSRFAEYVGGSGTAILLFRYVVQAGDVENVGVVLGRSLLLGSTAAVRDAAANAAGLTLPLAKTTGVKVKA